MNKNNPIEAAQKFIEKYFPSCNGALLAGSIVRGEATDDKGVTTCLKLCINKS